MTSLNAEAVGIDVLKKVQKGEKVVMGEIIHKHGYAPSIGLHPQKVTKTKSYQRIVKPLLDRYRKELDAILQAMALKDKNSEEYKVLIDAVNTVQKQIQLLSGGATENQAVIQISKEISDKHNVSNESTK